MEQDDRPSERVDSARRAVFPVTSSVLSASALGLEVERGYGFRGPVDVSLLSRWLSDVYLVRAGDERFVLKVYRAARCSREEIEYELELARQLATRGARLSLPIARSDGEAVTTLEAPEGTRHAVLFSHAPGRPPRIDASSGASYGRFAATLHDAMDGADRLRPRFNLDLGHILADPVQALDPFLEARRDDRAYLRHVAARLARAVEERAASGLTWGICHGDLNGGNVHVDAQGVITGFDLDRAGPGWRAYDLAVFRWGTLPNADADATWAAFLDGYRSVRPIAPVDVEAVPTFVACRAIWFAGLLASNSHDLGAGWVRDWHLDELLTFLRDRDTTKA